jgi:hypothetical protein
MPSLVLGDETIDLGTHVVVLLDGRRPGAGDVERAAREGARGVLVRDSDDASGTSPLPAIRASELAARTPADLRYDVGDEPDRAAALGRLTVAIARGARVVVADDVRDAVRVARTVEAILRHARDRVPVR